MSPQTRKRQHLEEQQEEEENGNGNGNGNELTESQLKMAALEVQKPQTNNNLGNIHNLKLLISRPKMVSFPRAWQR
jgi:hypothetical protein